MKRPALIPNWQQAHRLLVIRAAALLFVLNLAGALLALLAEDFPSRIWLYANTVLAAVIGYVRLVAQPGVLEGGQPEPPSPDAQLPAGPPADNQPTRTQSEQ
jgi:hypothetical protein